MYMEKIMTTPSLQTIIHDILYNSSLLTNKEKLLVNHFHETCCQFYLKDETDHKLSDIYILQRISTNCGIDISKMKKNHILVAIWIIFLSHIKENFMKTKFYMKYQTITCFLQNYSNFNEESEEEKYKLMNIANWMNIFFCYIPPKNNKGLVLQVIPKLVEGWNVKYVLGSGQTRFTKNREFVFQVEANLNNSQKMNIENVKEVTVPTNRNEIQTRSGKLSTPGISSPVYSSQNIKSDPMNRDKYKSRMQVLNQKLQDDNCPSNTSFMLTESSLYSSESDILDIMGNNELQELELAFALELDKKSVLEYLELRQVDGNEYNMLLKDVSLSSEMIPKEYDTDTFLGFSEYFV